MHCSLRAVVWGLGFGVWGLGFGVWGLGFGVWGLGFGVWVLVALLPSIGTPEKCYGFGGQLQRGGGKRLGKA